MTLELASDLVLAGLLLLAAVWCGLLSRRLRQLRLDRGETEAFVAAVEAASARAEAAIAGIREAAREAQATLVQHREQIEARAADLARLAEGGLQMARRLELVLDRGARTLAEQQLRTRPATPTAGAGASRRASPASAAPPSHPAAGFGRADDELLRVLETLR